MERGSAPLKKILGVLSLEMVDSGAFSCLGFQVEG